MVTRHDEVRNIVLTLHDWRLPSIPTADLHAATREALKIALALFYPMAKVEVLYNAYPDEPVLSTIPESYTAYRDRWGTLHEEGQRRESRKGAKLELGIPGAKGEYLHRLQHVHANIIEGILRTTMQCFIEHDAATRFRQKEAAYKRIERAMTELPSLKPKNPVLT